MDSLPTPPITTTIAPATNQAARPLSGDSVILIVEDDLTIQANLADLLGRHHHILVANNGVEGLRLAKQHQPHLILLDGVLPGMDGFEMLWNLKESPTTDEIPVIFLTQLEEEGTHVRALEAGATDFLPKAASPAIIMARVRNQLRIRHSMDCLRDASMLDRITGLPNRVSFENRLNQEWHRAHRTKSSVTVVFGDIDFFKPFVDKHGEVIGNQCLREVGQCLAEALPRASDLVTRYGWDEYGILLIGNTQEGAKVAIDRAHDTIRERCNAAFPDLSFSVSFGIATGFPGQNGTVQELIQKADERLKRVQQQGGDAILA